MSAIPPVSSVPSSQEEPGDLTGVPEEYHDLRTVFSRSRATSLPPHWSYDCSIDLLPGTTPPRGRLYSLSAPERKALEDYLSVALDAGTVVPSSSPDGAGGFVKKKDGTLRPCVDYRGLNDITLSASPLCLQPSRSCIDPGFSLSWTFVTLTISCASERGTSGKRRLTLR